jgi:ribosomal protein L3 glutamine methyltransferase
MTVRRRSAQIKAPRVAAQRMLSGLEQAVRESLTLRDCLRHACTRLSEASVAFGQGTDNAWDEAVWLGLWSLHLPPERVEPFLDARLTSDERQAFLSLIERRCRERLPAAYLTGEAWLRGLRFRADPRAIIPRSLIVEALAETLDDWLAGPEPVDILDLCTGGASIAISAALRFPQANVDAIDLSPDALALAAENLADHRLNDRISLFHGDLFAPIGKRQYDLILCNPPYVNTVSMRELPPEFLAEPGAALAGGNDGMDLVRRILADAPTALRDTGLLLLEIGHEAPYFEEAFAGLEFAYLPVEAGDDQLVLVSKEQLLAAGFGTRPRKPGRRR